MAAYRDALAAKRYDVVVGRYFVSLAWADAFDGGLPILLDVDDLPDHIQPGEAAPAQATQLVGMSLQTAERELIKNTLAQVDGNRVEAATILGIGERTLYRKIKSFGLVAPDGADDGDPADLEEIGA